MTLQGAVLRTFLQTPLHFPTESEVPASAVPRGRGVASPKLTPLAPLAGSGLSGPSGVFRDRTLTGPLPVCPPTLANRMNVLFPHGFQAAGRGSAGWAGLGSQGSSRWPVLCVFYYRYQAAKYGHIL